MRKLRSPDLLRTALVERAISQRELARLASCPHSLPGKLLDGQATSDTAAVRIARALRQPVDGLFEAAMSTVEPRDVNEKAAS